jgi:cell division protein FtsW
MFLVSGLLMCVPFVMGVRIKGNLNWISFGPMMRLQPSEIAKIVIILWGATLFTSKRKTLEDPRHLLFPFLPGALVLILLTVLQHDLGTSIIMGLIVVAMLWNVGASFKLLGGLAALIGAGALALVVITPNRLQRIWGFLDPTADLTGINYQPSQAQFALASGGWWGVGLGYSRMKWGFLSEAHTDYILAITGEELGLVGTLFVLLLFVVLTYGGFMVALRSTSFYARIVAAGITCWLAGQALVNVFVVLRLLPVLGIPLPLVSYGGSSLVMTLAGVGILLRCALEEPEAKAFLARHKQSKQPRGRVSAVVGVRRRRT